MNLKKIKFRVAFWLYLLVQPSYNRLESFVQIEINRVARLRTIAEGTRLWYEFRNRRSLAELARLKMEKSVVLPSIEERIKLRQAKCKHTKGGNTKAFALDYNVNCHTFLDCSRRIKCLTCGREWWHTNTYKDPEWDAAIKMVESSTNTRSCSESRPDLMGGVKDGPDNLPQ